ncbi:glycosyltransferase family 4 protein [Clostridium sp. NSJ-6]|uniref:Glycosyltransferase family 4 protein n=1 Tax=Clostridium hominis TaxID=2763036 RepID=A0ABR7DHU6_9CLOT|nr:glycosyltransferase family 4 protein [Clostridium hominis]MBC5630966.1 glycosyltransferase family 4 protein [Clostridium hominis]MDU2673702.1 glycosyltransferase family 4 protein [Clostridium sp.]
MKKVLMLGNSDIVIYNFRRELIEKMIKSGYEVYVSLPYSKRTEALKDMGCIFINTEINGRGTDIFEDIKLCLQYLKTLIKVRPDVVLTYTIKPNIYGGIACRLMRIPYICNITGLGSGYLKNGLVKKIIKILSRISYKKATKIFFQNTSDMNTLINDNILTRNYDLLPGSGVNLERYNLLDYPDKESEVNFSFIARVMKDKGIDEYLEAAKSIKVNYPRVNFSIIGKIEEVKYRSILSEYERRGIIKYEGFNDDIIHVIEKSSCIINPSYSEGMSNVLLEGAACGRPLIASDIPGCREIIDNDINGLLFNVKSAEDLIEKIDKFINLDYREKVLMGLAGRIKVQDSFNRDIVVDKYMNLINSIERNNKKYKLFKIIRAT